MKKLIILLILACVSCNTNNTDILMKLRKSTVKLDTQSASATGFILSYNKQKYMLTAGHFCTSFSPSLNIIKLNKEKDLCILNKPIPSTKEGLDLYEGDLYIYDAVYTIGYPYDIGEVGQYGFLFDLENIETETGVVSAYRTSLIIYPGQSGSPVVNKYGEVIGMVQATDGGRTQYGYLIPKSTIKEFLDNK